MTNEALLKRLIEIKNTLSEEERAMIDECINKNHRLTNIQNTCVRLANLILDVKDAMEMDYAKRNGAGEKLKSARNILKYTPDCYEVLKYAYTDRSGIQTICNSFCMIRLTDPLNLPELPSDKEYIPVKRIMVNQVKPITLELPSVNELRSYYKLKKAEKVKEVSYDFGENLPMVNAEMLIDVMTLVPNAVATWEKHTIVFNNDKGDYAMLLIVRKENG